MKITEIGKYKTRHQSGFHIFQRALVSFLIQIIIHIRTATVRFRTPAIPPFLQTRAGKAFPELAQQLIMLLVQHWLVNLNEAA